MHVSSGTLVLTFINAAAELSAVQLLEQEMAKAVAAFNVAQIERLLQDLVSQSPYLAENISERQLSQLVQYVQMLHQWNQAFNLSAIREPEQMLTKHILDSLVVARAFEGYARVLDVGTGAGLPGIPLAIFFAEQEPSKKFYLLDSLGKRIQFLKHVKVTLGLKNVEIIQSRVEDFQVAGEEKFDAITSRAFTALDNMTVVCEHLLAEQGRYLLLKGKLLHQELESMPARFELEREEQFFVPGLQDHERYLVTIQRTPV